MRKLTNKSGFTLLEIIIVIIIVGVLASLALPKFFATIEYSRSTEALAAITATRGAMERCYLQRNGSYANCTTFGTQLDIPNPQNSPNAHFNYAISGVDAEGYTITATRNTRDGGVATSVITLIQTSATVTRTGEGAFAGLN